MQNTPSKLILPAQFRFAFIVSALLSLLAVTATAETPGAVKAGDAALGTIDFKAFETPEFCGASCHTDFYQQWKQAMMSQAYTHHWDEIEYFKLAVPHADKDPMVAGVKAGCNGCHAPLAFLAGDVPPAKPEANSRANESVSCDLCHSLTGFEGDTPFNFNWIAEPGEVKFGPRETVDSPAHKGKQSDFLASAEFCGTCHNEKDPYGIWVKSTHLEWKEGPYAAQRSNMSSVPYDESARHDGEHGSHLSGCSSAPISRRA